MLNENVLKTIGTTVRGVLKVTAMIGIVGVLSSKSTKHKTATYSDAVNAIMCSTMYSGDKTKAVSALQSNRTEEFYNAVCHVVKSTLYSDDKLQSILNMCKQGEEV